MLSGFCWSLGKKHVKRGLMVFGSGLLITVVTLLVMPENRVVFGVLTLTGSCMLLMIGLEKVVCRISAPVGLIVSLCLFVVTRNVNSGYLGFEGLNLYKLPEVWYQGYTAAYLGFPPASFYSTDYFSLIPWLFLFISGYFLYRIFEQRELMHSDAFGIKLAPFTFLGRHSLLIYLLHQPVLYLIGMLVFA